MKPILMSTPMVQATLDGRKTVTRRVVKGLTDCTERHKLYTEADWRNEPIQMMCSNGVWYCRFCGNGVNYNGEGIKCKYGNVGDILWVRETSCYVMLDHAPDLLEGARDRTQFVYKASVHSDWMEYAKEKYGYKWKPSIFMPFDACRIFLEITSISVERLQDITEEDALREGIRTTLVENYRMSFNIVRDEWELYDPKLHFKELWQSINGLDSWDQNPWVWRIEYKRVDKPTNP